MTVGLQCLAGVAFSTPLADITFQTVPYETCDARCVEWQPA